MSWKQRWKKRESFVLSKNYGYHSDRWMKDDFVRDKTHKIWACNCLNEAELIAKYGEEQARVSRFEHTEADKDGVCKRCGYYAVWMPEQIVNAKKQHVGIR
jgi:hypothetical protein